VPQFAREANQEGIEMAEEAKVQGPDFEEGVAFAALIEGQPFLGHVGEEPVVLVRRGGEVLAIGATCTHYGGPLAEGLVVGDTGHPCGRAYLGWEIDAAA
jgi:nitrite reductase/ring-hydroxylating ferredoxin subunit